MKHPVRPRDSNQLAKLIIDIATGQVEPDAVSGSAKPPADTARLDASSRGGTKGGPARAAKLSPEKRAETARKAALARWGRHKLPVT